MGINFATAGLPLAERLEAWSHAITSVCGPYNTDFGRRDAFSAEIVGREIDDLHCARITQNSVVSWRSRRQAARVNDQVYYLILQMRGASRMAQNGRESLLQPGDMTLIDSGRPWTFSYAPGNVQMSLHLPRTTVDRHRNGCAALLAGCLRGGLTKATGALICSLFEAAAECDPRQNRVARDALLNLVLSTVFDGRGSPAVGANATAIHAAAIHRYIRANLADSAMTPSKIAAAHGISVRHLHRLFEASGRTLGDWIREARLERCAQDLRDESQKSSSVTDIAYRWGFNDSAHFSRTFKREFGQSPRHYRGTHVA